MSGFPSLAALQGQWPARAAAPRSSKLNSVTRAGQRQPGTHSCSPARSHLPSPAYHLLPCARTFKLGKGRWKGRGTCHNSPHLNSAISPTLPPPHFIPPPLPFPLRSSQCPVCGGRDWVHIITSPQPEGSSIFRRTFHNLPIARCPNTLIIHFSSRRPIFLGHLNFSPFHLFLPRAHLAPLIQIIAKNQPKEFQNVAFLFWRCPKKWCKLHRNNEAKLRSCTDGQLCKFANRNCRSNCTLWEMSTC